MSKQKHERYYPKKQRRASYTKRYAIVGVLAFLIWLAGFIVIQVLDFGEGSQKINVAWTIIIAVSALAFNIVHSVNEIKKEMEKDSERE